MFLGCNGKNCMLRAVRRSSAAATQTVIWPSPSMIQALEFKYVSGMVVFYSVLPNAGSLATCDLGQLVIWQAVALVVMKQSAR